MITVYNGWLIFALQSHLITSIQAAMKLEDQILGVQNAIIEGVYVYKSSFVKIIHTLILKEVNCFCVNDVDTRKCQFNFLENICVY